MTYCRRFKNEIVRAYAQDHFFDVITNSIGLATAVLAIKFYWWLDPVGAILVYMCLIFLTFYKVHLCFVLFLFDYTNLQIRHKYI